MTVGSLRMMVLVLAIICAVLGIIMFFRPNWLVAANRLSKKWIATDKLEKTLNRTRDVDAKLFGMSKALGFILLMLAIGLTLICLR